jgi:RNA polymerase sigma factor (sigma-70 family)
MRREDDRDQFVIDHLNLVQVITATLARRTHGIFEFDDLYQSGCLGLVKAARTFDPSKAASKTYLQRRITGEILDYMRTFPYFRYGLPIKHVDWEVALELAPVACPETQRAEMRVEIHGLMRRLNPVQRAVIECGLADRPRKSLMRKLKITEARLAQIAAEAIRSMKEAAA